MAKTFDYSPASSRRGSASSYNLSPTSSRERDGEAAVDCLEGAVNPGSMPANASLVKIEIEKFCRQHGMRDLLEQLDHTGRRHSEKEFLASAWLVICIRKHSLNLRTTRRRAKEF